MTATVAVGWVVLTVVAEPQGPWLALLMAAIVVASWRAVAEPPLSPGGLIGDEGDLVRRGAPGLTTVELEVAGAIDPRLGGDRRLQQRLLAIATHRARVDRLDPALGRELLGDAGWDYVTGPKQQIGVSELNELIERIESI